MRFGIAVPNSGPLASRKAIRETAEKAEELEFDFVWVHDHISYGRDWLGHRASGLSEQISPETEPYLFESISTLNFLAGFTERIQLGTSVLVLPLRNPLVLGRQLITLQALSNGRVVLGIGNGDYPAEFKVMGVPYEGRGAITEEYLEVLRKILCGGSVSYHGKFLSFDDAQFYPKVKPPSILIGGGVIAVPEPGDDQLAMPVMRRIARLADGWMPVGSPKIIERGVKMIKQLSRDCGRENVDFEVALSAFFHLADSDQEALKKTARSIEFAEQVGNIIAKYGTWTPRKIFERSLIGSANTLIKLIEDYEKSGVTAFKLLALTPDIDSSLRMMEKFSNNVVSSF